jgi:hypothetical protein
MYNKAFRIETEGHMLNGAEVKVYTDDDDLKQEFAKGQNDNLWSIHEILSDKMINNPQKEIGVVDAEISLEQPSYGYVPQPVIAATQPFTFQVEVPAGVVEGQQIQVQHPNTGQILVVAVPPGVAPGGVFNVSA